MKLLRSRLENLASFLEQELIKEILEQKHRASGNLAKSIQVIVKEEVDKLIVEESHLFYGDFVDRGRKAGVKRVPILALEQWVKLKGFAPGNERGVAFAIQRKIFEEGIPTSGSRKIAPRRLNWLTGTVERNRKRIEQEIDKAIALDFQVTFDEILKDINEKLR